HLHSFPTRRSSDLEHPITAAPAANPSNDNIIAIATLEIGAVKAHPIKTATKILIIKGRCVVDQLITSPNPSINVLIGVPINFPVKNPTTIVTNGVTIISTFVNLYTNFPTSVAHKTAT